GCILPVETPKLVERNSGSARSMRYKPSNVESPQMLLTIESYARTTHCSSKLFDVAIETVDELVQTAGRSRSGIGGGLRLPKPNAMQGMAASDDRVKCERKVIRQAARIPA
ncbi:hypothetical protein LPJ81_007165, partial [Coemansia sp. IMI 209127]